MKKCQVFDASAFANYFFYMIGQQIHILECSNAIKATMLVSILITAEPFTEYI